MANYYEILEIPATASKKEIETAIDQQYTYWHRLVTHHNPVKVEEANRSLRLLEEIRGVLTNSAKRKKYDAEIGAISGKTAGLADPQATAPRTKLPSMNIAQNITHQEPAQATTDAWICGKCKTPNRIGLKFCGKCGMQIGRECIKCNKMVSAADAFCPHCGVNIAKEQARRITEQQEKERQKEMEEAARIARQRESERIKNEQEIRLKNKQRKSKQLSCFMIAIFVSLCVFASYLLSSNTSIFSRGFMSQSATDQALETLYAPTWKGNTIQVQTWLSYSQNDRFYITFKVENLTQNELVVAFLTSDIVLTDNLGKRYDLREGTRPVRDTLRNGRGNEYRLEYLGTIESPVTSLSIAFPSINGETATTITIPLRTMDNQLLVTLSPYSYNNDSFNVRMDAQNNLNAPFLIRFQSNDITVSDDAGNVYNLSEYYQNKSYASLIEGKNNYSDSWSFEPSISPSAKNITINAYIMGQNFSQFVNYEYPSSMVRYEGALEYVTDNQFHIKFKAFNLGESDFLLRFDSKDVKVQATDGSMYFARTDYSHAIMSSISSGGYQDVTLYFDGALTNKSGLKLIFPVISAQENVQVDIQSNGQ